MAWGGDGRQCGGSARGCCVCFAGGDARRHRRRLDRVVGEAASTEPTPDDTRAGGRCLVAVAVSPVRMAASNSIDRIVAAGDTSPGGSVAMRLDLWAVGVEMIRLRPVLGWGPDTYAIVFPEVDDRVLDAGSKAVLDQFRPESPHNLFLEVTQGAGLLGLGAMMTVIGGAVAMIIRGGDRRVLGLVLPVIVGYLVAAQFMTSEWASSTLFWLVLGVGVGRSVEVRARA